MNNKSPMNSSIASESRKIELEKYEDAVETLAKVKSDYIFQNDNADHASIVIKTILKYAKSDVAIFDDDLSGDVSDRSSDFLDVVREFVRTSGKVLRIVIKTKSDMLESKLAVALGELVKFYPDKIQVKLASDSFIQAVRLVSQGLNINEHINFAVSGDHSFRLEFPAGKRKAFCSFRNENYAPKLLTVFNNNFDECSDYFQE